jgi:hypothetical protein
MENSPLKNSLPIFSSVYFGEIPYFKELAKYNTIYIDPNERYKKQTWRNRTQILTGNGPLILSVPIQRIHGKETLMKEALISEETDWRKDHWKAIESAYMHAPYFFYYGYQIKELIYLEQTHLFDLNQAIFLQILKWLDINLEVKVTNQYNEQDHLKDYRIQLEKKKFTDTPLPYIQVFSDKIDFKANLSIIDLLMNEGPLARKWIVSD